MEKVKMMTEEYIEKNEVEEICLGIYVTAGVCYSSCFVFYFLTSKSDMKIKRKAEPT